MNPWATVRVLDPTLSSPCTRKVDPAVVVTGPLSALLPRATSVPALTKESAKVLLVRLTVPVFVSVPFPLIVDPLRFSRPVVFTILVSASVSVPLLSKRVWIPVAPPRDKLAILTLLISSVTVKIPSSMIPTLSVAVGAT